MKQNVILYLIYGVYDITLYRAVHYGEQRETVMQEVEKNRGQEDSMTK